MRIKKKELCAVCCTTVAIWCIAITLGLNFRPLYYFDMKYLNIELWSGFSKEVILENYKRLIEYNQIFFRGDLRLTLPMSETGRIHFIEVKRIFDMIQLLGIGAVLGMLLTGVRLRAEIGKRWLLWAGGAATILPLVAGALIAINWEQAFVLFHQICFRNDYWIFDQRTDPVIKMLPDEFFFHSALIIIFFILCFSILCVTIAQKSDHRKPQKKKGFFCGFFHKK